MAPAVFDVGALVHVRTEPQESVVVLPGHRPAAPGELPPEGVPDLAGQCCVPVALVRTPPAGGALRWIEIADLTRAEADDPSGPASDGMSR